MDILRAGVSLLGAALDGARLLQERERAARAKDEFLAMLGHELRNPLSPIVTSLHLIKMRSGTQFAREQEIIDRQLGHLIRLVDDLLDISRITSGKVALSQATIPLSEVAAKAVETVGPLMHERNHLLSVDVPHDLLVHADLMRLSQVLQNLLINAAKYTDPGGRIDVRAWAAQGEVHLSVRDNGVGIDAQLLPKVFDIFTQGARQIERSRGGLGLGLALVKSLVSLHGGRVRATSAGRGQGSEFVLSLPVPGDLPQSATSPQVSGDSHAADTTRKSVLVVDDNEDAALSLVELLKAEGFSATVAHDATAALSALDRHVPQFAVLDIGLPGMDGYELAGQIRGRHGARCPTLIALTGFGQAADRDRALRAGFDFHLVKPVDFDKLFTCLRPDS
jgi:CheY-like chemotaxis protein/two-component sensor histidine kinase